MEKFLGLQDILDYGLYLRAIGITLYAIVIFRLNLSRLYGNHSALDFIIFIILGAILGEAIVNNIPLLPSLLAVSLIVLMYKALAYLCYKYHKIGKYIKGDKVILMGKGEFHSKNLKCTRITKNDVLQSLRLQWGLNDMTSVDTVILERGGQISFQLKKNKSKQI